MDLFDEDRGGLLGGAEARRVNVTFYHPGTARTPEQRAMEGPPHDRFRRPLYTLEAYWRGEVPFVTAAGDPQIWPDGQRIVLPELARDGRPMVVRVTDSGGTRWGVQSAADKAAGRPREKLIRVEGHEPIDLASETQSPAGFRQGPQPVEIVEGDGLVRGTLRVGRVGPVDFGRWAVGVRSDGRRTGAIAAGGLGGLLLLVGGGLLVWRWRKRR